MKRTHGLTVMLLRRLGLLLVFSIALTNAWGDVRPTFPDISPTTFQFRPDRPSDQPAPAFDYHFHVVPLEGVPPELVELTILTPQLERFLRQLSAQLPPDLQDFLTKIDFDVSAFPTGDAPFGAGSEWYRLSLTTNRPDRLACGITAAGAPEGDHSLGSDQYPYHGICG